MLTSLALIFLVGLAMASICQKMKLPRIIGMLVTGIALGQYALNLLDASILGISADLRQMALVIILIKAGLSIIITAPLGALGMDMTYQHLLEKEPPAGGDTENTVP